MIYIRKTVSYSRKTKAARYLVIKETFGQKTARFIRGCF